MTEPKSVLEMMRDEIIERLDELFYGPFYPDIPNYYTTNN